MNKLDVLARINPQMKAVLAKEDELAGDANDTSVGFEVMRENYIEGRRYWTQGGPRMLECFDEEFKCSKSTINLRFYYPDEECVEAYKTKRNLIPAIIYIHGGGFCLGNLDTHDRICRLLAAQSQSILVAIDYSLSPEARFPSALEEVVQVALYLHKQGRNYGIDGQSLAFAGDSGGAHFSLAASLYLRQECGGADFIKCLLLYYGWYGLNDSASMRILGGPWDGLTEQDWEFYLGLYAPENPDQLRCEPYANLFLNDLSRDIPACYIAAAEYDPLRDDSYALAAICEQFGTAYKYEVFEGVIHAFLHYSRALDAARDALEHGAGFFKEQMKIHDAGLT